MFIITSIILFIKISYSEISIFFVFNIICTLFPTEEQPPEVKPDLSPPAVKKEEPVIIEVKAQDGAAPVTTAAPPTASSGSGRRKKKQKVEPVVTGELRRKYSLN